MVKKKRRKPRLIAPDEQFSAGPLTFSRFGRFTVAKSSLDEAQFEQVQRKLAESYPKAVAEVDLLVSAIADRIRRLPPAQLLHRAWWEFAGISVGLNGKEIDDQEQSLALRLIDYTQSVITSVRPAETYAEEISEQEWAALKKDVHDLFHKLTIEYQIYQTAFERQQDPGFDLNVAEFRHRAQTLWLNVRGERYQSHEQLALLDILAPHSSILEELFGIDAPTLVNEVGKILSKLSKGLQQLFEDMKQYQDVFFERLEAISIETGEADLEILRDKVFERDPELQRKLNRIGGEMVGLDLFDVQKVTNLPESLLNELTWSPGEDAEFFSPGEGAGWPLRVWPTMKRPFIRLNGQICCFDMFVLFDNIYRVLQRTIFRLTPAYKTLWNERQKEVSEKLPFQYFEKILSGAMVLRPIYYRWKNGQGPAQWHEADGILAYDDHLFVVEVKAGAFTYTSPATDLAAHFDSLKSLVLSPANQGTRFVEYLESADEVSLFNESHKEIGKFRKADFRHVTICAITLDPFTETAARAHHLRAIGLDIGNRPIWVLSIDDLRIYADCFSNPLQFLHYVEQRMRAAQSELVDLNDEMDHFGLYIEQNNYSQFAKEVMGTDLNHMHFHGYRTPIDKYYSSIVYGEPIDPPTQKIPARLLEIVQFLSLTSQRGRSELVSFFLDLSGDFREEVSTTIDRELQFASENGRSRALSTYGEVRMTLYVFSPDAPRNAEAAITHTQVIMIGSLESSRLLIELEYSQAKKLIAVHWKNVSLDGVTEVQLSELRQSAHQLRLNRIAAAKNKGKVGANDPCPCGSGKKYKRCCKN
jgi:preprotein translocase subunit SecA